MSGENKSLIETLLFESGEMWRAAKDRTEPLNYVIVCSSPRRGWRAWVDKASGQWLTEVHDWSPDEVAEFFTKFGKDGWAYLVDSIMPMNGGSSAMRIRGFVYNGRRAGWSISTEKTTPQIPLAR